MLLHVAFYVSRFRQGAWHIFDDWYVRVGVGFMVRRLMERRVICTWYPCHCHQPSSRKQLGLASQAFYQRKCAFNFLHRSTSTCLLVNRADTQTEYNPMFLKVWQSWCNGLRCDTWNSIQDLWARVWQRWHGCHGGRFEVSAYKFTIQKGKKILKSDRISVLILFCLLDVDRKKWKESSTAQNVYPYERWWWDIKIANFDTHALLVTDFATSDLCVREQGCARIDSVLFKLNFKCI